MRVEGVLPPLNREMMGQSGYALIVATTEVSRLKYLAAISCISLDVTDW
jgi:hypothetical protein